MVYGEKADLFTETYTLVNKFGKKANPITMEFVPLTGIKPTKKVQDFPWALVIRDTKCSKDGSIFQLLFDVKSVGNCDFIDGIDFINSITNAYAVDSRDISLILTTKEIEPNVVEFTFAEEFFGTIVEGTLYAGRQESYNSPRGVSIWYSSRLETSDDGAYFICDNGTEGCLDNEDRRDLGLPIEETKHLEKVEQQLKSLGLCGQFEDINVYDRILSIDNMGDMAKLHWILNTFIGDCNRPFGVIDVLVNQPRISTKVKDFCKAITVLLNNMSKEK